MDLHHQSYRPRDMRDKTLGAIAYRAAIANGVGVMAATEARIEAQFGEAAVINMFKLRIERKELGKMQASEHRKMPIPITVTRKNTNTLKSRTLNSLPGEVFA